MQNATLSDSQREGAIPLSKISNYANQNLPKRAAINAGLEKYSGPWTATEAAHLLRRACFGFTALDLKTFTAMNVSSAVDQLLKSNSDPSDLPINTNETDPVTVGETWVNSENSGGTNGSRRKSLKSWWILRMLTQPLDLKEKMTLFWHNHFATEGTVVGDARMVWVHLKLLRNYAFGNFKQLTREITFDPAMLRYLNGNTNVKGKPNENYGRELQELFTIGKGPEKAPGDYTNYTEQDVIQAARVLTGWKDNGTGTTVKTEFYDNRHDSGDKTFSAAFGGKTITGRSGTDAEKECDDLLTMIFDQDETARAICRKLYRFFVYYTIDATTEKNVIVPLAKQFKDGGFEVKPILATLFKSSHFFDVLNRSCLIKTPCDYVMGSFRSFGITLPSPLLDRYNALSIIDGLSATMQMELFEPPNVAGWPAYYQEPIFHEAWINSDTLPKRIAFTDTLAGKKGYSRSTFKLLTDPTTIAKSASPNPGNVNLLLGALAAWLLALELTEAQVTFLKEILLDGNPDYVWTQEWDAYIAAPTDTAKKTAVENKLRNLFVTMTEMAEYQLA